MSLKGTNVNSNNVFKMAVDEMKKNETQETEDLKVYNLKQAEEQVKSYTKQAEHPEIKSIKANLNFKFDKLRGDTYDKLEALKDDSVYVKAQYEQSQKQVSNKPLWKKIFKL